MSTKKIYTRVDVNVDLETGKVVFCLPKKGDTNGSNKKILEVLKGNRRVEFYRSKRGYGVARTID